MNLEQRLLAKTTEDKEVSSPFVDTPCWRVSGTLSDEYAQMWVDGKMELCHRVAYKLWVGVISEGFFSLHKCDNRRCINPDHLFSGKGKDNSEDMVAKNRQSKGEPHSSSIKKVFERTPMSTLRKGDHSAIMKRCASRGSNHYLKRNPGIREGCGNPNAKLTEEDIRYIRMWAGEEFPHYSIAEAFKITKAHASAIIRRERWAHII